MTQAEQASTSEYLQVSWWGTTDPGTTRENNEDAFLGLMFNARRSQYLGKYGSASLSDNDFVFAVSDGMGGANAGEFASKIAIEKITQLLPKGFRVHASGMQSGFTDLFEELYQEIHKALVYLGSSYPECSGMGSTLSLCWLTPKWLYYAHLGDSRIYYQSNPTTLKQLTSDHNHVGWLFREGKINEREARTHPRRHGLQKALGADYQFVSPQVGAVALEPGSRFLLCSDGLIEGLWNKHLLDSLNTTGSNSSPNPAERLVTEAVERSGVDNTTALILELKPI
ncbi:MAG: protein phosphatase 2C domain-containing protein [Verrucomicrobiota bacterium]